MKGTYAHPSWLKREEKKKYMRESGKPVAINLGSLPMEGKLETSLGLKLRKNMTAELVIQRWQWHSVDK